MKLESIFSKHHITQESPKTFDFGKFILEIKREKEGWFLKTIENTDSSSAENNLIEKENYFHTGRSNSIILSPALQAKPLVFKGNNLMVVSQQKLTFFIKIPLIVQVYFSKPTPENLLKEYELARLSDTWFGEPDNGEPAFSIGNNFSHQIETLNQTAFEAICPITVFNNSASLLEIQRLIIRVENLSLYKYNENIITSLVKIEYKGKDTISSANFSYSKTYHGEKPQQIANPRSTDSKSLLKINFHFIRNIYRNE